MLAFVLVKAQRYLGRLTRTLGELRNALLFPRKGELRGEY
jgi:hypothetical protein